MTMISVESARDAILANIARPDAEDVALRHVAGRTLADAVVARTDQPPFHSSAMDGYAVLSTDCTTPGVTLICVGEAAAGHGSARRLVSGEAIRIFTGAPLPAGADAVVIQEDTHREGDDRITLSESVAAAANVRPRAQDFANGDVVLAAGLRLAPRHVLLAAASGHAHVRCLRRPRVALLSTGDELVEPGEALRPGQIYASNAYGLAALVERFGGVADVIPRASDTRESLNARIAEASAHDILVTIGGASVGEHDLVRDVLTTSGAHLDFYKVAMRPGKPVFFGRRDGGANAQRILGLPGNPVSAMIAARVFLVPLLTALLGQDARSMTESATLASVLPANGPRTHFMRGRMGGASGERSVTPAPSQDSSMMRMLAESDCLIVVPPNAPAQAPGATVTILPLDL